MSIELARHFYEGVTFPNHCFAVGCGKRNDDPIHIDYPEPVEVTVTVPADLFIAPDANDVPCIWQEDPDGIDPPACILRRTVGRSWRDTNPDTLPDVLWAILAAVIPTREEA